MKKYANNRLKLLKKTTSFLVGISTFSFIIMLCVVPSIAEEAEFINFKLEQSTDTVNWYPVDGDLNTGFFIELDPSITYKYIDVRYASTNVALKPGMYGFNLTSYPVYLFSYWDDKGVDSSAVNGTWQAHMWKIINGNAPMFYLSVSSNQMLSLVDGLMYGFFGVIDYLKVNGDYPLGAYSFEGNIISIDDDISVLRVDLDFVDDINNIDGPTLISLDIIKSNDQSLWYNQNGSLYSFYICPVNSSDTYYWLEIDNASVDGVLNNGLYGFYLTSYPSGFFAYWASKGVTASSTPGTWQAHMWRIINGEAPSFYINYSSTDGFSFIDGLYRDFHGYSLNMPYRINGDITKGMYSYSGTLTSTLGIDSNLIEIDLSFIDNEFYQIWVDNNYDSATPGWGVDHFSIIEDGINACPEGGIVHVEPGRYKEVLNINKAIILQSTWGPTGSFITDEDATYSELLATDGYTVRINNSHVLLSGFGIERFESVERTAAVGNNVDTLLSHIEVYDCEIESFYDCIRYSNLDYVATRGNEYDSQTGRITLNINDTTRFVLSDDETTGYDTYALKLDRCENGFVGDFNLGYRRAIGFFVENSHNIKIKNNYFSWMQDAGIYVNNSDEIAIISNDFIEMPNGIRLGTNSIVFIKDNTYESTTQRDVYRAVRIENQDFYYSELQKAIDNATVGQNLYLHEGYYYENIVLDKKLAIHGLQDNNETIIMGDDSSPAFLITNVLGVKNVFIEDLSIQGGYHGLKTGIYNDTSGLRVENCIIQDPISGNAVYIDPHNYSNSPLIRQGTNIFTNPVQFRYCYIRDGFYYQYWPYEIYNTNIADQLVLKYNDIDNVFLNGSISVLIQENDIQSLGMMYSSDIQILKNTFENPWEVLNGIYLWSINGTPDVGDVEIIENSILQYDRIGILVAGAHDVTIKR